MNDAHLIKKHPKNCSNTPTYLLLDIHGVLTDGKERKRCLVFMENKYGMNHEQHNKLWLAHLNNLDRGLEQASEYIDIVNKTFHTHFSVKEYYRILASQIVVNKVLFEKLQKINSHRICIISDNFLSITICLNTVLGEQFKQWKKFYSFRLGTVKSENLLKKTMKALNATPEDCLFIDDNEKNIEVAKKIGMKAILFKTNKELFSNAEMQKFLLK